MNILSQETSNCNFKPQEWGT